MSIVLTDITDEELHQMLTEIESSSLGLSDTSLVRKYMSQLPAHVAIIQAPIEIYKEGARRWMALNHKEDNCEQSSSKDLIDITFFDKILVIEKDTKKVIKELQIASITENRIYTKECITFYRKDYGIIKNNEKYGNLFRVDASSDKEYYELKKVIK